MARTGDFIYATYNYLLHFYSDIERKIAATGLLQTIIANVHRAIEDDRPRFIIYGGHDTTLQILLTAL
jgi:hypothetical protein